MAAAADPPLASVQIAEAAKAKIPGAVTEIAQLTTFYPAESYHQQYLENVRKSAFKNDVTPVLLLSLLCCFPPVLFARDHRHLNMPPRSTVTLSNMSGVLPSRVGAAGERRVPERNATTPSGAACSGETCCMLAHAARRHAVMTSTASCHERRTGMRKVAWLPC